MCAQECTCKRKKEREGEIEEGEREGERKGEIDIEEENSATPA